MFVISFTKKELIKRSTEFQKCSTEKRMTNIAHVQQIY